MMLVVLIEYIYINTKTSVQKETYLNHFFFNSNRVRQYEPNFKNMCCVVKKSHYLV